MGFAAHLRYLLMEPVTRSILYIPLAIIMVLLFKMFAVHFCNQLHLNHANLVGITEN
jgi:hypothetical protein